MNWKIFFQPTKSKVIWSIIIFVIHLLLFSSLISFLYYLPLHTKTVLWICLSIIILGFLYYLTICCIVSLFSKKFRKNKKNQIIVLLILIFANPFSATFYSYLYYMYPIWHSSVKPLVIPESSMRPLYPCGSQVVRILPGGPAELAGIQENEIIYKLNNEKVISPERFKNSLEHHKYDKIILETINGTKYELNCTGETQLGIEIIQAFCS